MAGSRQPLRSGSRRRYAFRVERAVASTTPTAEKPALRDEERAARLRALAERVMSPEGLDRQTLAQIETLTSDEQ